MIFPTLFWRGWNGDCFQWIYSEIRDSKACPTLIISRTDRLFPHARFDPVARFRRRDQESFRISGDRSASPRRWARLALPRLERLR
jgi:hypothetical protein